MDVELRTTVCRIVAGLVVADDDFSPQEEAFIDRLLARFCLGSRDAILPIMDRDEAAAGMGALPPEVQQEALDTLVDAAVADGKVVDEELAYLLAVAGVIGLDEPALEARIAKAVGAG